MTIPCFRCTKPALPVKPDDCSEHPICGSRACRDDHAGFCVAFTVAQKDALWRAAVGGWKR